jgi:hypothetical protein
MMAVKSHVVNELEIGYVNRWIVMLESGLEDDSFRRQERRLTAKTRGAKKMSQQQEECRTERIEGLSLADHLSPPS